MSDWGPLLSHPIPKDMKVMGNSDCSYYHCGSICYAAKNTTSTIPGKGIMYWNLQWDVPLGWVRGEPLNLQWDPLVLLQTRSVEMDYTGNGTHIERGEQRGVLVWHMLPSPSPFPHAWEYCLSLTNTCGMHNQVKLLKLQPHKQLGVRLQV